MTSLSYQDIYLVPKHGILRHRSDANLSVPFLGRTWRGPWLPSNMSDVVSPDLCKWMSENGYIYFMHRFGDTYEFVKRANQENWMLISISVGENQADREMLARIAREELRVDFIVVDIAHGDSVMMKDMIWYIHGLPFKSGQGPFGRSWSETSFSYQPKIIAGNVATPEGVKNVTDWGADACKVGIAGGKSCSTKTQTGFHVPMFSCVMDCVNYGGIGGIQNTSYGGSRNASARIPVIADGGVRETGDFAKALVAGATLAMAGSVFAACKDAPGENIYESGNDHGRVIAKRYHGSASERQKGHKRYVEGFCNDLPCNQMTYAEKFQELTDGLSSAVSYSGGVDLTCLKSVKWVEVKG